MKIKFVYKNNKSHFEIFVKGKTISYGGDHRRKANRSISSVEAEQDSYKVKFGQLFTEILRGAEESKESLQRQMSQFSSDLSHFQYGEVRSEVRSKRHHRGQ